MMKIGDKIKEIRKLNNLSQTKMGSMLGTTQDSISLWELNKSLPDIETLFKICVLFNVSADYMLGLKEI